MTQTTGFTGTVYMAAVDEDLYVEQGLTGNPVLIYNATTGFVELDDTITGGGGGTPSATVVTETGYGQASTAGAAATYSRGDHTHGTPAAPPAAANSVQSETGWGIAPDWGTAATFSRSDHTHGSPADPTYTPNIEDGTVTGQMCYWDDTANLWKHDEITEMFWDDTNKAIGVGADSATYTPYSYLAIADLSLDTTTSYDGFLVNIKKTAGATDGADNIFGGAIYNEFDQNGGTIGNLRGCAISTISTLGTTTNIFGLTNDVTMVTGATATIEGYVGHVIKTAGTASADIIGLTQTVKNTAGNIGQSLYGAVLVTEHDAGTITQDVNGIYDYVHTYDNITRDILGLSIPITKESGNVGNSIVGTDIAITNTSGNVGNSIIGNSIITTLTAGTITNDAIGLDYTINQGAGNTISGNAFGIKVQPTYNGTVTGTTYGISLEDAGAGNDYGYYQSGAVPNSFRGTVGLRDNGGQHWSWGVDNRAFDCTYQLPDADAGAYDGHLSFPIPSGAPLVSKGVWTGDKQHFGGECGMAMGDIYASVGSQFMGSGVGIVAMRDGTITGISASFQNMQDAAGEEVDIYVYKNGAAINAACHLTVVAPNPLVPPYKGYVTFTPGTYTFSAGDDLEIYIDLTTLTSVLGGIIDVEYQTR
jgi:hypothetical protein